MTILLGPGPVDSEDGGEVTTDHGRLIQAIGMVRHEIEQSVVGRPWQTGLAVPHQGTSERVDNLSSRNHPPEYLACDDVVNRRHHRLLEANAEFGEDWHQRRSKGVKVLL